MTRLRLLRDGTVGVILLLLCEIGVASEDFKVYTTRRSGRQGLGRLDELTKLEQSNFYYKYCKSLLQSPDFTVEKLQERFNRFRDSDKERIYAEFYKIAQQRYEDLKTPFERFNWEQVQEMFANYDKKVEELAKKGKSKDAKEPKLVRRGPLYEEHCVQLSAPDRRSDVEFFHGSHIGDRFICSQAPKNMEDSHRRFWKMVFEKKIRAIVNVLEREYRVYYPTANDSLQHYGEYSVKLVRVRTPAFYTHWLEGFTCREAPVTITEFELWLWHKREKRVVFLYRVPGWVDNKTPLNPLVVIPVVQMTRKFSRVLVHCAAGLGRSGSYIALNFVLANIFSGEPFDMLDDVVRVIRGFRAELVYTSGQFVYLHYIILKYGELLGMFEALPTSQRRRWKEFELEFLAQIHHDSYVTHSTSKTRIPENEPYFDDFLAWGYKLRDYLNEERQKKGQPRLRDRSHRRSNRSRVRPGREQPRVEAPARKTSRRTSSKTALKRSESTTRRDIEKQPSYTKKTSAEKPSKRGHSSSKRADVRRADSAVKKQEDERVERRPSNSKRRDVSGRKPARSATYEMGKSSKKVDVRERAETDIEERPRRRNSFEIHVSRRRRKIEEEMVEEERAKNKKKESPEPTQNTPSKHRTSKKIKRRPVIEDESDDRPVIRLQVVTDSNIERYTPLKETSSFKRERIVPRTPSSDTRPKKTSASPQLDKDRKLTHKDSLQMMQIEAETRQLQRQGSNTKKKSANQLGKKSTENQRSRSNVYGTYDGGHSSSGSSAVSKSSMDDDDMDVSTDAFSMINRINQQGMNAMAQGTSLINRRRQEKEFDSDRNDYYGSRVETVPFRNVSQADQLSIISELNSDNDVSARRRNQDSDYSQISEGRSVDYSSSDDSRASSTRDRRQRKHDYDYASEPNVYRRAGNEDAQRKRNNPRNAPERRRSYDSSGSEDSGASSRQHRQKYDSDSDGYETDSHYRLKHRGHEYIVEDEGASESDYYDEDFDPSASEHGFDYSAYEGDDRYGSTIWDDDYNSDIRYESDEDSGGESSPAPRKNNRRASNRRPSDRRGRNNSTRGASSRVPAENLPRQSSAPAPRRAPSQARPSSAAGPRRAASQTRAKKEEPREAVPVRRESRRTAGSRHHADAGTTHLSVTQMRSATAASAGNTVPDTDFRRTSRKGKRNVTKRH